MSSHVVLKVYNVLGREVGTLVNQNQNARRYTVTFDASELPSGIYFYQLQAGGFFETKKWTDHQVILPTRTIIQ